jgi:hypothetical protein
MIRWLSEAFANMHEIMPRIRIAAQICDSASDRAAGLIETKKLHNFGG